MFCLLCFVLKPVLSDGLFYYLEYKGNFLLFFRTLSLLRYVPFFLYIYRKMDMRNNKPAPPKKKEKNIFSEVIKLSNFIAKNYPAFLIQRLNIQFETFIEKDKQGELTWNYKTLYASDIKLLKRLKKDLSNFTIF